MTRHEVYTCDWPLEDDQGTCSAQTRNHVHSEESDWLEIEAPSPDGQHVERAHLCPDHAPEVWGLFES